MYKYVFSRKYILGKYRLHHGASGLAILTYGLIRKKRSAMITGVLLVLDDICDAPFHWNDSYQPWLYPRKFGVIRLVVK